MYHVTRIRASRDYCIRPAVRHDLRAIQTLHPKLLVSIHVAHYSKIHMFGTARFLHRVTSRHRDRENMYFAQCKY